MDETGDHRQNPNFVEALARGLDVIQAFSSDNPEMTLSEVAARTGLSPATARRSLLTLQQLGYVGTHGKRFLLRANVLSLGSAFLNSMNLKDVADSFLQEVADTFHDAASFALLDGRDVLYVSHISSQRDVRYRARVGYKLPANATSLGHVLLANLPADRQEEFLKNAPFERYTSRTTCDADELRAVFKKVRAEGYAAVQDQLEYGVVAVAVPVTDPAGRVLGAVNCSGQSVNVELETMVRTRVPALRQAAKQISAALERHPALVHSILSASS